MRCLAFRTRDGCACALYILKMFTDHDKENTQVCVMAAYLKNLLHSSVDTCIVCLVIYSGQPSAPGLVLEQYGSSVAGSCDGREKSVQFHTPQGVAFYNEVLYVADTGNHLLRKVCSYLL